MNRFTMVAVTALALGTIGLPTVSSAADSEKVMIGPVQYDVPSNWTRQRPRNQMRLAQFGIPLVDGDEGPAEIVVFTFPGGAGTVEANLDRWKGMFDDVEGEPKVEKFDAGDIKITTMDITGTYMDKPAPFLPQVTPRKGYRMMVAVVDTPNDGTYYFRMTGPKATIAKQSDVYTAMLKSAKVP